MSFEGKCEDGPMSGRKLVCDLPRRTFAERVYPEDLDRPRQTLRITGYYDWSYDKRCWVWTKA